VASAVIAYVVDQYGNKGQALEGLVSHFPSFRTQQVECRLCSLSDCIVCKARTLYSEISDVLEKEII
jgi:hypothetical protein